MPSFLDALSYEFLRNALVAGVLASVLCGVIGTFVVVKKLAFISDGISHAAFGGMGICFFLGVDPVLGAVPVALACALAVAAESASFLLAFAGIGLMPDGGSTATVAASIGRARAMRMALLAEPLTGWEAHAAGLVSHLVDDDAFETVVSEVVGRLASSAPLGLAATKRAVNAAAYAGLEGALERERTGQSLLLRTDDAAEGMRAFDEHRPPDFSGR